MGEVSSNLTFDGEVLEEGSSESSLTFHNEAEPLVGEVSSNLTIDGEVLEEGLVEEVSCDETNEIDSKIGLMLIDSFMVQHHLTRQGREDLLSLLQILIPNKFPSSLYLVLNQWLPLSGAASVETYCKNCHQMITNGNSCTRCNATTVSRFHTIPVDQQVSLLFKS